MSKSPKTYSPEFRKRAVRMVLDNHERHESRWATIRSVSSKIGCSTNALHKWMKKSEAESGGQRGGAPTEMDQRLKALERENRELKQANEILRKASAYFAQAELDRRPKA